MKPSVAVVGAGVSGLCAAFEAHRAGCDVTVYESADRPGGVIRTERRDGFVLEAGPDAILRMKPAALDLARDLRLEPEIVPTGDRHRGSLVLREGRLVPIPDGLRLMAPEQFVPFLFSRVVSWPGKLRMALDLLLPARREPGDESLTRFVVRRLGREALERLAQPMLAGIYGADPDQLSLQATMPQFLEMERKYGSVIRGLMLGGGGRQGARGPRYSLFFNFWGGTQRLVDRLVEVLPEKAIRCGSPVSGVSREGDGWAVQVQARREVHDLLVLALPAPGASSLLDSVDPELARELGQIRYSSAATVNLGYASSQVQNPLKAFGFVAPRVEGTVLLACTFMHRKWPGRVPARHVLLRAFVGGSGREDQVRWEDRRLLAAVCRELEILLGLQGPPLFHSIHRWFRSMPEYGVGHLDRVARIEARLATLSGLGLCGNAFEGVGIPDCIRRATGVVRHLIRQSKAGTAAAEC